MNVPFSNKFLFFSDGDGVTAPNDIACYPVSSYRGADSTEDGLLTLYFTPAEITQVVTADDVDTVVLTITDHTHKAVLESIANELAFGGSALATIADVDNSVFVNSNISAVAITKAG